MVLTNNNNSSLDHICGHKIQARRNTPKLSISHSLRQHRSVDKHPQRAVDIVVSAVGPWSDSRWVICLQGILKSRSSRSAVMYATWTQFSLHKINILRRFHDSYMLMISQIQIWHVFYHRSQDMNKHSDLCQSPAKPLEAWKLHLWLKKQALKSVNIS
jgi:hypothetical protein